VKPKNCHLAASVDEHRDPEARVFKQAAGNGIDEKRNISLLNRTVIMGDYNLGNFRQNREGLQLCYHNSISSH